VYISDYITAVAGVDMGAGASLFLKRAPILLLRKVGIPIVIEILSSAVRSSQRLAHYHVHPHVHIDVHLVPALLVHHHLVSLAEAGEQQQVVHAWHR